MENSYAKGLETSWSAMLSVMKDTNLEEYTNVRASFPVESGLPGHGVAKVKLTARIRIWHCR